MGYYPCQPSHTLVFFPINLPDSRQRNIFLLVSSLIRFPYIFYFENSVRSNQLPHVRATSTGNRTKGS